MIDLEALPPSTLLTQKQAAEVLNTPAATLCLWRHRKNVALPYVKLGANVRYRASDLLKFLKNSTVAA